MDRFMPAAGLENWPLAAVDREKLGKIFIGGGWWGAVERFEPLKFDHKQVRLVPVTRCWSRLERAMNASLLTRINPLKILLAGAESD